MVGTPGGPSPSVRGPREWVTMQPTPRSNPNSGWVRLFFVEAFSPIHRRF